jgi:hypothetical protein
VKKQITIILGRGIEGCGVTKFTIEQVRWYEAMGYEVVVYATAEKKWTRTLSHDTSGWISMKFSDPNTIELILSSCRASEFVIVNSLPSLAHSEKCIAGFESLLEGIQLSKIPMVLVQHDHSSMSIKRNACIESAVKKADVLFGHSTKNDFAVLVETLTGGGGLGAFFGDDTSKKIFGFQPGMSFHECAKKYHQAGTRGRDLNHHKWIGRTTSWKGYIQMFKLHNEFLRKAGKVTTFEGIEKSPAYLGFRELSAFNGHITEDPESVPLLMDQPVYVFGPYKNDEMLDRMGRAGFGYQLSLLKERFIERSIEYTHCELVCTGIVPVFRKAYGERCTHRFFGKPLIECENTGTVWLDDDDMQPAFDLMEKLASNPDLYEKYATDAYEFYELHQDSHYTFAEMHGIITREVAKLQ